MLLKALSFFFIISVAFVNQSNAWYDETHLAIAKVAGYQKWFNAAGADVPKLKMGHRKGHYHFVNNPRGTAVTPEMVLAQVAINTTSMTPMGIFTGRSSLRSGNISRSKRKGAMPNIISLYAAHYIGDLSKPLHHTLYEDFNRRNHSKMDGIVNDEILENLDKIKVYPIEIKTEQDLARDIARIAKLSLVLGYKLEDERRLLTREEAYQQLSNSASLMKAV